MRLYNLNISIVRSNAMKCITDINWLRIEISIKILNNVLFWNNKYNTYTKNYITIFIFKIFFKNIAIK